MLNHGGLQWSVTDMLFEQRHSQSTVRRPSDANSTVPPRFRQQSFGIGDNLVAGSGRNPVPEHQSPSIRGDRGYAICLNHLQGLCLRGDRCPYFHVPLNNQNGREESSDSFHRSSVHHNGVLLHNNKLPVLPVEPVGPFKAERGGSHLAGQDLGASLSHQKNVGLTGSARRSTNEICRDFNRHQCPRGENCPYRHVLSQPGAVNQLNQRPSTEVSGRLVANRASRSIPVTPAMKPRSADLIFSTEENDGSQPLNRPTNVAQQPSVDDASTRNQSSPSGLQSSPLPSSRSLEKRREKHPDSQENGGLDGYDNIYAPVLDVSTAASSSTSTASPKMLRAEEPEAIVLQNEPNACSTGVFAETTPPSESSSMSMKREVEVCPYFLRSNCPWGPRCHRPHPESARSSRMFHRAVCRQHLQGRCTWGRHCNQFHPETDVAPNQDSSASKDDPGQQIHDLCFSDANERYMCSLCDVLGVASDSAPEVRLPKGVGQVRRHKRRFKGLSRPTGHAANVAIVTQEQWPTAAGNHVHSEDFATSGTEHLNEGVVDGQPPAVVQLASKRTVGPRPRDGPPHLQSRSERSNEDVMQASRPLVVKSLPTRPPGLGAPRVQSSGSRSERLSEDVRPPPNSTTIVQSSPRRPPGLPPPDVTPGLQSSGSRSKQSHEDIKPSNFTSVVQSSPRRPPGLPPRDVTPHIQSSGEQLREDVKPPNLTAVAQSSPRRPPGLPPRDVTSHLQSPGSRSEQLREDVKPPNLTAVVRSSPRQPPGLPPRDVIPHLQPSMLGSERSNKENITQANSPSVVQSSPKRPPGLPPRDAVSHLHSSVSSSGTAATSTINRQKHLLDCDPSSSRGQPTRMVQSLSASTSSVPDSTRSSSDPRSATPRSRSMTDPNFLSSQPVHHVKEYTERLQLRVLQSTKVVFGPGLEIKEVTTGFESRWLILGNVPRKTTRSELWAALEPFGEVLDIKTTLDTSSRNAPMTVKALFANTAEVTEAAAALNGVYLFNSKVYARLPPNNTHSGLGELQDTCVRVTWDAPCWTGFAGYNTMSDAERAISSAEKDTSLDTRVTAAIHKGMPVLGAFNVVFHGLPTNVGLKYLEKYGKPEAVMIEKAKYEDLNQAIRKIRFILQTSAELATFDISPPPYRDGKVRGRAYFLDSDSARAACNSLNGRTIKEMKDVKIWADHLQFISYTLPPNIFRALKNDIESLRDGSEALNTGNTIVVIQEMSPKPVVLRLFGNSLKGLGDLKSNFERLLRGDSIKNNGEFVWDPFFANTSGAAFIAALERQHPSLLIQRDVKRRKITVFGPEAGRFAVRKAIVDQILHLHSYKTRRIPLPGVSIGHFMNSGLTSLQDQVGRENVAIDLTTRSFVVRGDAAFDLVRLAVQEASCARANQPREGSVKCPVCWNEPTAPIALRCGHVWCKGCLVDYFSAAIDNKSFPMTCLGDEGGCSTPIPLSVAQDVLSSDEFENVTRAAFLNYVNSRPGEFQYCPTPDCPEVYRTAAPDIVIQCPSCLTKICAHCRVEHHEGMSCAERESGMEKEFAEWRARHDVKHCPGCNTPIQKIEGCNHMTCTVCHTHLCWVCLQKFPAGEGVYDHMRMEHGGIGV